jgi:hypothetical protein
MIVDRMATLDDTRDILCIGDLVEDGVYRVHSHSGLSVRLTDGARVVSVVPSSGDAGPLTLILGGSEALAVRAITIEGSLVLLDGMSLRLDGVPTYDSALAFDPADLVPFRKNLDPLRSALAELAPGWSLAYLIDPGRMSGLEGGSARWTAEHIAHCVRDMLSWDTLRGVRRLGGRGLAPSSGGGFVEGLLVAMNIIDRAGRQDLAVLRRLVFEEARTRDVVEDALLYAASEGFVSESVNGLVSAMAGRSAGDVRRSVRKLVAARGSRGADAAVALYMTLHSRLAESAGSGRLTPSGARSDRLPEARWC